MEVPNVKRKDYQLIGVEDDFLSLMDDIGDTRDDLKCPEDSVGDEIKDAIAAERDIMVREFKFSLNTLKGRGDGSKITKINTLNS